MKYLFLIAFTFITFSISAQTILGQWEPFDDKTNEKKGIVEIFEDNGEYFASIVAAYIAPSDTLCLNCPGDKKNKPFIGLKIIEGLMKNGNTYEGGTILDPQSGRIYRCYLALEGELLKVRGYLGFSIIGRTQYWRRKT